VDVGHRRHLDIGVEIPDGPARDVCSHETWEQIVTRMSSLIREPPHDARLRQHAQARRARGGAPDGVLGEGQVTSHHGSLSARAQARRGSRLKAGDAARARRDLVPRAGDRHRRTWTSSSRPASRLDRDLPPARRPERSRARDDAEGRIFPLTEDDLVTATALSMRSAAESWIARRSRGIRSTSWRSRSSRLRRRDWDETTIFDDVRRAGRTAT
jgi:hypothetical protein